MQSAYADVDLDESPVIVLACGHIMTMESFDCVMSMTDHYAISEKGDIIAPKASSKPFSVDGLKACPLCRAPFHDVRRYNRIIKRGLIDESTKKFIVWANANFVPLEASLHEQEEHLRTSLAGFKVQPMSKNNSLNERTRDLNIMGTPRQQVGTIRRSAGLNQRYVKMFKLRQEILTFMTKVNDAEQPFGRVYQMVQDIRRRRGVIATDYGNGSSILRASERLLASVLLIRCDLAILSDFVQVYNNERKTESKDTAQRPGWLNVQMKLDFSSNRNACLELATEAVNQNQPVHMIEANVFFARFVALERSAPVNDDGIQDLVAEAKAGLSRAREVCDAPNNVGSRTISSMIPEIEDAEKMLREETFYSPVTNEEKRAVYAAMAQSFLGTGHWYHCENGHPVSKVSSPFLKNSTGIFYVI
jgi:hypothetical protein